MSCNRENEIWQSANGTWSLGFYSYYDVGDTSDPDWDHEWDVEYEDYFWWVSTGHPTEHAAMNSWDGSNPGSHTVTPYTEQWAKTCDEYDAMAQAVKDKGNNYRGAWSR